jgi:acyl carrier protein
MTQAQVRMDDLRVLIAEVLEVEPDELTDTGDFIDEYDADSLRAIEIVARIEKQWKVEIPQSELPELRTLKAVHESLLRHTARQG